MDDSLRHPRDVEGLRALTTWLMAENGPGPDMALVRDISLAADGARSPRLRVLEPRPTIPAVVVYLPGPGCGWVAGSLEFSDAVCRKLAERSGCAFVTVEHRTAPEHPYPAASDDAWQVLHWAEEYRRSLGRPTPPLVLVGEGTGGALASVLARRSQEAGGPFIGSMILISPTLGIDVVDNAHASDEDDGLFSRALIEMAWGSYVPCVGDRATPDVMPLHARNFEHHPPTLLLAAEHDPLKGHGDEYLARLDSAGVTTDRQEFGGQMHGFFGILELPQGERAFQAIIAHLRRYVARTPVLSDEAPLAGVSGAASLGGPRPPAGHRGRLA